MQTMMHSHTDDELLQAWREGDADAGAALFGRHWASVNRFFANKIGPDGEDLVQATFLGCIEARDRYRGESNFRAFLFGIARKKLLRYLRTKGRDQGRFDPAKSSIADSVCSLTSFIDGGRKRAMLMTALRNLPVDTQIMLELHYWENLKVQEIAEVVELPVNTVKTRMRRGRIEIASAL